MGSPPQFPEIIEDLGPATSGGASRTQKVLLRNPDGTEWEGYAKFAQDVNGQVLAENGARGLASELMAARLAAAIGANAPAGEPVMLQPGVSIRLRNGEVRGPGLAFASHALDAPVDIVPGAIAPAVDPREVADLAALHSLIEAQDRGHNLVDSHDSPYSVDHPTAFNTAWNLTDNSGQLVLDTLIEPTLAKNPAALREAAQRLDTLTDAEIDQIIDALPRDWVPSDDHRARLARNIKAQRDSVSGALVTKVDEYDKALGAP